MLGVVKGDKDKIGHIRRPRPCFEDRWVHRDEHERWQALDGLGGEQARVATLMGEPPRRVLGRGQELDDALDR